MRKKMDERLHIGTSQREDFTIHFFRLPDGRYEVEQYCGGNLDRVYDDLHKDDLIHIFGTWFQVDHISW